MSKKRNRKRQRVNSSNSRNRRLSRQYYTKPHMIQKQPRGDRRMFSLGLSNLPIMLDGRQSRIIISNSNKRFSNQTKAKITFANSRNVTVCQRRWIRRAVLFAKRKAGLGVPGSKLRIFNHDSKIKCRR